MADTMTPGYVSLDDFLTEHEGDSNEPPRDAVQADAMLRRLAKLEAEARGINRQADDQVLLVEQWRAIELDRIEEQAVDIRSHLAQYTAALRRLEPKRGTWRLPHGTLKSSAAQPVYTYEDEAAFLAWALVNAPEVVRQPDPKPVPPAPEKNAVKKAFLLPADAKPGDRVPLVTADGEVVPGVVVEIRDRQCTADVGA